MDNQNKDIPQENTDKRFKDTVFNAFSKNIPDAYKDENGFIVIPASTIEKVRKDRRHKHKRE